MDNKTRNVQVVELYLQGLKIKEIESITGCKNVYTVLKRNGVKTTRAEERKISEKQKDEMVSDYLSGVSIRDIRKKYKSYELYSILEERGIEYKQNNKKQKELYDRVIELYHSGMRIEEIEEITKCKSIYRILSKFKIERNRDPKQYNSIRKTERNQSLIEDYLSMKYTLDQLSVMYGVTTTNIYRILNVYSVNRVGNKHHHFVIHQMAKEDPNRTAFFYILENYYGYTKIGITTKTVTKRYRNKKINVFYEISDTLQKCFDLESELKQKLKQYRPQNIDRKIDGWSECFDVSPEQILTYINNRLTHVS